MDACFVNDDNSKPATFMEQSSTAIHVFGVREHDIEEIKKQTTEWFHHETIPLFF